MVFLCFSVKDRFPIIHDFYHYLSNFGLEIWYDRQNTNIGDDRRKENIDNGVKNKNIKYAIIFYSDNFANGRICKEEYQILVERYYNQELKLFPVFLHGEPFNVDQNFSLCTKLVFKVLKSSLDYYSLSLFILAKITQDELDIYNLKTIRDLIHSKNTNNLYYKLLFEYENIDKKNYSMRISMLFSIFMMISSNFIVTKSNICTMKFIFYKNCKMPLKEENKELQIMENIVVKNLNFFELI